MTPERRPIPVIPVLVFAAIDLLLAAFLLVDGGITLPFVLIALIGVGLAALGWVGLRRMPPAAGDD